MSKSNYDPLQLHLAGLDVDEWATTFTEIESLLGFRLPKSARAFNAWWSNSLKGPSGTVAWRHGVLDEARRGRSARRIKWTADTLAAAWVEFNEKYGVPVNLSVGKSGAKYPRSQLNEASRIYSAALRLGLVDWLKGKNK